jgi:hypothetical protein
VDKPPNSTLILPLFEPYFSSYLRVRVRVGVDSRLIFAAKDTGSKFAVADLIEQYNSHNSSLLLLTAVLRQSNLGRSFAVAILFSVLPKHRF